MATTRKIALALLILLLVATFPAWPYATGLGWYGYGGDGLVIVLIVALLVL